jgi:hypothetical protein
MLRVVVTHLSGAAECIEETLDHRSCLENSQYSELSDCYMYGSMDQLSLQPSFTTCTYPPVRLCNVMSLPSESRFTRG